MIPRSLGWEIAALLTAKLVLLCGFYFAFFASDHRVPNDAPSVSARLFGSEVR
jgi:hypothetical protein